MKKVKIIAAVIILLIIGFIFTDKEKVQTDNKDKIEATAASHAFESRTIEFNGVQYTILDVDGGDMSGSRQANAAVDIGYGDRQYWAFTNEYGQLIAVTADAVTLQDDSAEHVNADGRYYDDEAKVPGTEREDLDEGHIIADSLGGVSNAYNITPQNSTLNRHGDQAYMEKVIRDAGGCTDFVATITYPDTETQTPSHYHYEYVLGGEKVIDDFYNVDPDVVNQKTVSEKSTADGANINSSIQTEDKDSASHNLSDVDTDGNGKVTISEAKAAGYSMPIYSDHWLYQYMDDKDGDGKVGE